MIYVDKEGCLSSKAADFILLFYFLLNVDFYFFNSSAILWYLFFHLEFHIFEILGKAKLHVVFIVFESSHAKVGDFRLNIKTAKQL